MARKQRRNGLAKALAVSLSVVGIGFVEYALADDSEVQPAVRVAEISARGRIEPKDGVRNVVGPSQQAIFVNVVSELNVHEGDLVRAGQVIAVFDSYQLKKAEVARLQAEVADTERELKRIQRLRTQNVASESDFDQAETKRDIARAMLARAEADLELALVRSPIDGRILKVHVRPGERVAIDGIVEIGATDAMYVVAEVYESDIERVLVGARAVATTPSMKTELLGTVEEIGWRVGKMDVLDTDPATKTDARVVEVKIRLDDSAKVARMTNMQVEVRIASGSGA